MVSFGSETSVWCEGAGGNTGLAASSDCCGHHSLFTNNSELRKIYIILIQKCCSLKSFRSSEFILRHFMAGKWSQPELRSVSLVSVWRCYSTRLPRGGSTDHIVLPVLLTHGIHACCLCLAHVTTASVPESNRLFIVCCVPVL